MRTTPPKRYDRAYFDRWYRHGGIGGARRLARKVALAVATAEYHLERPVRTVLDIGCGEGPWRAPLLKPGQERAEHAPRQPAIGVTSAGERLFELVDPEHARGVDVEDPRLGFTIIQLLLAAGYFALRSAVRDPGERASCS